MKQTRDLSSTQLVVQLCSYTVFFARIPHIIFLKNMLGLIKILIYLIFANWDPLIFCEKGQSIHWPKT